jgi:thymidylate kinase
MIIICEGLDKCGKSTFIKNACGCVYEANNIWCADITRPTSDGKYEGITTLDMLLTRVQTGKAVIDKVGLHFDAKDDPITSLAKCLALGSHIDVYMDRSFISELVYGRVYRNGCKISLEQEMQLIEMCKQCNVVILYFRRKLNTAYFEQLDSADKYENNRDAILKCNKEYVKVMQKLKKAGVRVYEISETVHSA